jgi:hypothetical protein
MASFREQMIHHISKGVVPSAAMACQQSPEELFKELRTEVAEKETEIEHLRAEITLLWQKAETADDTTMDQQQQMDADMEIPKLPIGMQSAIEQYCLRGFVDIGEVVTNYIPLLVGGMVPDCGNVLFRRTPDTVVEVLCKVLPRSFRIDWEDADQWLAGKAGRRIANRRQALDSLNVRLCLLRGEELRAAEIERTARALEELDATSRFNRFELDIICITAYSFRSHPLTRAVLYCISPRHYVRTASKAFGKMITTLLPH